MAEPARARTFVDGIGATLALLAALALLEFANVGGTAAELYRDQLRGVPVWTRLVLHPGWRFGAPLLGVVVAIRAILPPPPGRHGILAIGLAAAVLAIASYVALYQPIFALAGTIRAD